jgi:hypothetical protein
MPDVPESPQPNDPRPSAFPQDTLTATEVAAMLRLHPGTVRLKPASGENPGRQIGNRWCFSWPASASDYRKDNLTNFHQSTPVPTSREPHAGHRTVDITSSGSLPTRMMYCCTCGVEFADGLIPVPTLFDKEGFLLPLRQ